MGSPARAAKDDLSLQCLIEAQPEYPLGKPVTITGTLHNAGSSAMWILCWNTFLEPKWLHGLAVTHNGSPVPYIGTGVSRGIPTKEAYVRIPAGTSLSRQIDINENYDIAEGGDYQVLFDLLTLCAHEGSEGEWPQDQNQYNIVLVESARVTFRISDDAVVHPKPGRFDAPHGVQSDAPRDEGPLPAEPMAPTFRGLSPEEMEDFQRAHRWAYHSILKALRSVEQKSVHARGYDQWMELGGEIFREGWQGRAETVKKTYRTMAGWMATTSIVYRKANPPADSGLSADTALWTRIGGRGEIGLVPGSGGAFDNVWAELFNWHSADWVRAFRLIHEIAHAAGGLYDYSPLWTACRAYTWFNPSWAVANPSNYAYFAMNSQMQPPPGNSDDNGIWVRKQVTGTVWGTTHSPAATDFSGGVLMMAWRDWAPSVKGQLWYKILLNNKEWYDAALFRSSTGAEIRSLLTPALAVYEGEQNVACVYIDSDSKKLVYIEAFCVEALRTRSWSNWSSLSWRNATNITDLAGASPAGDKWGPALAAYNKGIYCVYVDASDELKCIANRRGDWITMDFDKPRHSASSPTLAVFDGQLRCAYRDKTTKHIAMVSCIGSKAAEMPVYDESYWDYAWHDEPFFVLHGGSTTAATIALTQRDTLHGPRLVALGTGSDEDKNLRYAESTAGLRSPWWTPLFRTTTFASTDAPALAACGSVLHAFFRREDGYIDWITSR